MFSRIFLLAAAFIALCRFSLVLAEELEDGTSQFPSYQGDGEWDYSIDFPHPKPPRTKVKACWKDSEPRGKGHLPDKDSQSCPDNQEKSMGICYPRCGPKRVGFGPVCIDDCKATIYTSSAALFCCDTDDICKTLMEDAAMKLPRAFVRFAIDVAKNPNDVRKIASDFREFMADAMQLRLPLCSKLGFDQIDDDTQVSDITSVAGVEKEDVDAAEDAQAKAEALKDKEEERLVNEAFSAIN